MINNQFKKLKLNLNILYAFLFLMNYLFTKRLSYSWHLVEIGHQELDLKKIK